MGRYVLLAFGIRYHGNGDVGIPALNCRTCFWRAGIANPEGVWWCAHIYEHGWIEHIDKPRCEGRGYDLQPNQARHVTENQ